MEIDDGDPFPLHDVLVKQLLVRFPEDLPCGHRCAKGSHAERLRLRAAASLDQSAGESPCAAAAAAGHDDEVGKWARGQQMTA